MSNSEPYAAPPTRNNLAWLPSEWDDWSPPDPKAVEEQLKEEFTDEQRAEAWNKAAQAVKTHHDELVERWQRAMDSILVYAGLFSAVLTAFNVQSYQLLQPAPTDPMIAALQQISAQLNSFSINPSFINSTQPSLSPSQLQPPFRAPVSAVWINALWFSSLVCSLASASVALMVKQWLYEESKGLSGTSREAARLRQYRLNSLIKWKVGTIILVPSVLLQVALFLFLSGLLILLWTIHKTVAAVITVLICPLFIFVFVTTILPTFKLDCCYRSPQAYGAVVMLKPVLNGALWLATLGLHWFYWVIPGDNPFETLVWSCYQYTRYTIPRISTWYGAEQTEIARDNGFLDRRIATMAYTTTFSTEQLKMLHIILSDLPCDQVFSYFSDIHRSWIQLWGPNDATERSQQLTEILVGKPFYCALRKVLTVDPDKRRDAISGNQWMELTRSGSLFSSYNVAKYLPRSGALLSTLALISIDDSVFAKETFGSLYDTVYYDQDSKFLPSTITYDALRDVMAMSRYNVEHWLASDEQDAAWRTLLTVRMSLECTRWILTNNLGLTGAQEAWIRSETRSLLCSITEKLEAASAESFWLAFGSWCVHPLTATCKEVSRGHEMVPDELVQAIQKLSLSDAASFENGWMKGYFSERFKALKDVLRQKHHSQHAKPCFHAQQSIAIVF
ncbi:hypothetical protein GSI_14533 [Ganoderma sinense ZZ0214-1]|uniref:DUF6535 domain-containing protein n=1 Tax=Ganoderma sinense ZZ0214-1 TaxID=1077348 RepID=A0A2G8RNX0_9APHY|nr:hypothetical protein GSI_14533 [Ganoderma sinense ZZ0214-1]